MHGPDIQWYVILSAILFTTGALGVMLRRRKRALPSAA